MQITNNKGNQLGDYLKNFVAPYYEGVPEKNDLLERITQDSGNKKYSRKFFTGRYYIDEVKGKQVCKLKDLNKFPNIDSKKFKEQVYPTDSEVHKKAEAEIKSLIDRFKSNDSPAAQDLKKLLENSEVVFRVKNNWNYPNGSCAFKAGKGNKKNQIVICISNLEALNKQDALPEILAHELGHAVDFSKRPPELRDKYMDGTETAVDMYASSLLAHAGITERGFSDFMGNDYDDRIKAGKDTQMLFTPDGGYRRNNFRETRKCLDEYLSKIFPQRNKQQTDEQKKANKILTLQGIRSKMSPKKMHNTSPTPMRTMPNRSGGRD